jgi:hypothetical protein
MTRGPVTCKKCGYTTIPVSGFCPRCLERLPLGRRRIGVLPLVAAGILGVLVLGSALAATLRSLEPGRVAVQAEGSRAPASSPAGSPRSAAPVSPASTEPQSPRPPGSTAPASQSPASNGSSRPSAQAPSATALAPSVGSPAPSPSSAASSPGAVLPSTATDQGIDTAASPQAGPHREDARTDDADRLPE